jgi:hypothetical protein
MRDERETGKNPESLQILLRIILDHIYSTTPLAMHTLEAWEWQQETTGPEPLHGTEMPEVKQGMLESTYDWMEGG